MNRSGVVAPHRQVLAAPTGYALVALASLLLSLWALYLDPVINSDGVSDVRAAQYFRAAEWRAGIEMAGQPLYALMAGALSRVSGLTAAHALYALNAGLYALLSVGFTVLAAVLGGGRRGCWLAAGLVLLFPALNDYRSFISSDAGYWAGYVWSLAWFMHWAATPGPRRLDGWLLAGGAALLFVLEAAVIMALAGLWLAVHRRRGVAGRLLKLGAALVAGLVLLGYALWEQQWHAHIPVWQLLLHPLAHLADAWQQLGQALGFKLAALGERFLSEFSQGYARVALLAALLSMAGVALLQALGPACGLLAGIALLGSRSRLATAQRHAWRVFVVITLLTLLVPAATQFAVSARDAMPAALTLLAIVPPVLAHWWREATGLARPALLALLGLMLLAGAQGLDLRSDARHLREAGLWLRANASPEASLYSNSRVLVYYSGLYGYRPWADYSWQEAMRMVWQQRWREYRYLALVIEADNAHREGILMRKLDLAPLHRFTSRTGDTVLLFDTQAPQSARGSPPALVPG